jgi:hypothetical protein
MLCTLASCSGDKPETGDNPAAASRRLWTIQATWDTTSGAAALYDPYAGRIVTATRVEPGQSAQPGAAATISAVDPRTGRQTWNMITGQPPQMIMVTDGLVLVATSGLPASDILPEGGAPSVFALDEKTGSKISEYSMASGASALGVTGGTVIAADKNTLYGYSDRSGDLAWWWRPPAGCTLTQAAASADIAVTLSHCGNGNETLTSLNPGSGTSRWTRTVGYYDDRLPAGQLDIESNPYQVSAQGSFVTVAATASASVFSATGAALDTVQTEAYQEPLLAAGGSHLFLAYMTPADHLAVQDVNVRTRAARTLLNMPAAPVSVTLVNGTLYILADPSWPVLPAELISLDPATGAYSTDFMPIPGDRLGYYTSGAMFSSPGELLFAAGAAGLTAYSLPLSAGTTPDPGLQAAAPRTWPRACALLSASALSAITGGTYESAPRPAYSRADTPATACQYTPRNRKLPVFYVAIAWEAQTIPGAQQLMHASAAGTGMSPVPGIGDQTLFCEELYLCALNGRPGALIRVGNTVAAIQLTATSPSLRAVASKIAAVLRRERTANG